ncbi:hypothetical protein FB467_1561 [Ornithinicoccus hortensis]|uniref:Uncharacterized protein n=1 Tax=Ornithinicoccus hortensis TaxID=82346 RepID=A0A542YQS1_9MICO|nr:hypothetical protein FB467_1561 [Ornithinicoccus hortensis]
MQRQYILAADREEAQTALRATYEMITIAQLGGGDIVLADQFWRDHLHEYTLSGLLGELLAPLNDTERKESKVGVSVIVEQSDQRVTGIRIKIHVVDPQRQFRPGAATFVLNKVFQVDEGGALTSKVETIVAPGRSRPYFRDQLLPILDRLGITKISLTASQIMGYDAPGGVSVWARYGFIPDADQWGRMRDSGQQRLAALPQDAGIREHIPALQQIYQDEDPKALRPLALLAMQSVEVAEHVTAVLLVDQNWIGTIDLGDPEARRWITTYVRGNTEAFLAAMGVNQ